MRLLCWNMNAGPGSTRARLHEAWSWLDAQDVDIALLQETVIPDEAAENWGSVSFTRKYTKHWGSAVLTRDSGYRQWRPESDRAWLEHLGGAACIAEPTTADLPWLVSLHSNAKAYTPDELAVLPSTEGVRLCNADGLVFEIDLALHDLRVLLADKSSIVGGDLNSSLLWDQIEGHDENARLFSHFREAGLIDLRPRHQPEEQQTFFNKNRNGRPHQLDHVFADQKTEKTVISWRVLHDVVTELELSDHAPIVVET